MKKYAINTLCLFVFICFVADNQAMDQINKWLEIKTAIAVDFTKEQKSPFYGINIPAQTDNQKLDNVHNMSELITMLQSNLPTINDEFKDNTLVKWQTQKEQLKQIHKQIKPSYFQELKERGKVIRISDKEVTNLSDYFEKFEQDLEWLFNYYQKQIETIELLPKIVARMKEVMQTQNIDFIDEQSKKLRKRTNKSEID